MSMRKRNTLLAFLMSLILGIMSVSDIAEAVTPTGSILARYVGSVDGVKREVRVTSKDANSKNVYFKVGESDFNFISNLPSIFDVVVDTYDSIWFRNPDNYGIIMWWNYNISPDLSSMSFLGYHNGVESFVMDGSIAVGYKFDGKTYPLPTFEEMKDMIGADPSIPEPHYIPETISDPIPSPAPATPSPLPKNDSKISIQKSKSKALVYKGNKLISKATLKKGTLTWERGKKKSTYKNVKCFTIIEKSTNLVFLTKKGAASSVSYKNGKRKVFIKKGAEKIKESKGFGVQIHTKSKDISIKNK